MQCAVCHAVYSNALDACPRCKRPADTTLTQEKTRANVARREPNTQAGEHVSASQSAPDTNETTATTTAAAAQAPQSSTLIEFPGTGRAARPQWRKDLSERVREIQQRRAREAREAEEAERRQAGHIGEIEETADEAASAAPPLAVVPPREDAPELNPLVAAALRRIERARRPLPPPPMPRSASRGKTAAAAVARYEEPYTPVAPPVAPSRPAPSAQAAPAPEAQKPTPPVRETQRASQPAKTEKPDEAARPSGLVSLSAQQNAKTETHSPTVNSSTATATAAAPAPLDTTALLQSQTPSTTSAAKVAEKVSVAERGSKGETVSSNPKPSPDEKPPAVQKTVAHAPEETTRAKATASATMQTTMTPNGKTKAATNAQTTADAMRTRAALDATALDVAAPSASVVPAEKTTTRRQPTVAGEISLDRRDAIITDAANFVPTVEPRQAFDDRAPLSRRFAAGLVDAFVIAFFSSPFAAIIELTSGRWHDPRVVGSMIGIILLVMFLYIVGSTALAGYTWGMSLFSLHAVDARTAMAPTTGQSIRRALFYMLSLATCGLPLLYAFFDAEGRAVHDHLSGTIIVRE